MTANSIGRGANPFFCCRRNRRNPAPNGDGNGAGGKDGLMGSCGHHSHFFPMFFFVSVYELYVYMYIYIIYIFIIIIGYQWTESQHVNFKKNNNSPNWFWLPRLNLILCIQWLCCAYWTDDLTMQLSHIQSDNTFAFGGCFVAMLVSKGIYIIYIYIHRSYR